MNSSGHQPSYQSDHPGNYKVIPPSEADWAASNNVAVAVEWPIIESPYVRRPLHWPPPAPMSRDLSATTLPEEAELDDTLLRQVLAQFGVELRSPMPEEVVARIEEETPEVPAEYDLATYEYEYIEKPAEDSV